MNIEDINNLILGLKDYIDQVLNNNKSYTDESVKNAIDHINTLIYTLNQRINELENNQGPGTGTSEEVENSINEINVEIDMLNQRIGSIITKEEIDAIFINIFGN